MGGFQKYPVPRRLHTHSWLMVPNYTKNIPHLVIPITVTCFLFWRHSLIHSVIAIMYNSTVDLPKTMWSTLNHQSLLDC